MYSLESAAEFFCPPSAKHFETKNPETKKHAAKAAARKNLNLDECKFIMGYFNPKAREIQEFASKPKRAGLAGGSNLTTARLSLLFFLFIVE